jgi:hypothetical protein
LYLGFHSTLFMAALQGIWCVVFPVWTFDCHKEANFVYAMCVW